MDDEVATGFRDSASIMENDMRRTWKLICKGGL